MKSPNDFYFLNEVVVVRCCECLDVDGRVKVWSDRRRLEIVVDHCCIRASRRNEQRLDESTAGCLDSEKVDPLSDRQASRQAMFVGSLNARRRRGAGCGSERGSPHPYWGSASLPGNLSKLKLPYRRILHVIISIERQACLSV